MTTPEPDPVVIRMFRHLLHAEAEASVALDRDDEIGTYTLDEIGDDHDDA